MADISAPELRLLNTILTQIDAERIPSEGGTPDFPIQNTARAFEETLRANSQQFNDKISPNAGEQQVNSPLLSAIFDFITQQKPPGQ